MNSCSMSRRHLLGSTIATVLGAIAPTVAEAAPNATGQWSAVHAWPDVAIHMTLLADGTILTWADDDAVYPAREAGHSKTYRVHIPTGEGPLTTWYYPNTVTNLFCAGQTPMANGDVFVIGGHNGQQYFGVTEVSIFERSTHSWITRHEVMNEGRWYATAVPLGNGDVLALSGSIVGYSGNVNDLPQVWLAGGGWRNLDGARKELQYYPRCVLAPNGQVYVAGNAQETFYLDTSGSGRWRSGPRRVAGNRYTGACVVYDEHRLLYAGGGGGPNKLPYKTAEIIDLAAGTPRWTATGSMAYARRHCSGVLLPDGTVFVVGGTSGKGTNNAAGRVLTPELWNPATGSWKKMAAMQTPRLYHSSALLLPDGRVLVAGGGRGSGGVSYQSAEIFSPPYLFAGERPAIVAAPAVVGYGTVVTVETSNPAAVTGAVLIRCGSTTHGNNMSQGVKRFTSVVRTAKGIQVSVPASTAMLPPGPYMLFVLAGSVPSVAKIITVG